MPAISSPIRIRSRRAGQAPRVDMTRRVLHDVAVCCRGEALGHDQWIDDLFLGQVANAINAEGDIETRHTHYGEPVGHVRNARLNAGTVRGDLCLDNDDQADYLLRLAAEDPASLGLSVAFINDTSAEKLFTREHADPDTGAFRSPDEENRGDLPHCRLARLLTIDIVDEPAACPTGLFHRKPDASQNWDALLSFILGLTDQPPTQNPLGIHPDRCKDFALRFLTQHRLVIRPKGARQGTAPTMKAERRQGPAAESAKARAFHVARLENARLQRLVAAQSLGVKPVPLNPCRIGREQP